MTCGAESAACLRLDTAASSYAAFIEEDSDPWVSEPSAKRLRLDANHNFGENELRQSLKRPWVGHSYPWVATDMSDSKSEYQDREAKRSRRSLPESSVLMSSTPAAANAETSSKLVQPRPNVVCRELVRHRGASLLGHIQDALASNVGSFLRPIAAPSTLTASSGWSSHDLEGILASIRSGMKWQDIEALNQLVIFRKGCCSIETLHKKREHESDDTDVIPGLVIYADKSDSDDMTDTDSTTASSPLIEYLDDVDSDEATPMDL